MGFLVDKITLWKVVFQFFGFSLQITIIPLLPIHHQRLVREAAVLSDPSHSLLGAENNADQPQTEEERTVVAFNLGSDADDGPKHILV
jgi:hypothetical protein